MFGATVRYTCQHGILHQHSEPDSVSTIKECYGARLVGCICCCRCVGREDPSGDTGSGLLHKYFAAPNTCKPGMSIRPLHGDALWLSVHITTIFFIIPCLDHIFACLVLEPFGSYIYVPSLFM
jgi:hypothetical protein